MQPAEVAIAYRNSGLSVIPIRTDGSKIPAVKSWKPYEERLATEDELAKWFKKAAGYGIITGAISGNLEVIDFDDPTLIPLYIDKAKADGKSELIDRLVQVSTPSEGLHLWYRCDSIAGNQKLAMRPMGLNENGKPVYETLIETRGEGGYVLAPGSPAACHPTQKRYAQKRGHVLEIPLITPAEREYLLMLARGFDERTTTRNAPEQGKSSPEAKLSDAGIPPNQNNDSNPLRPGDDFNARADWNQLLTEAGWTYIKTDGTEQYWKRPGSTDSKHSATVNYKDSDCFKCFSTSTPFETDKGYTKFDFYTKLYHNGNFSAAAQALVQKGYGSRPTTPQVEPRTPDTREPKWRKPQKRERNSADLGAGVPTIWNEPALIGCSADKINAEPLLAAYHPEPIASLVDLLAFQAQVPVEIPSLIVLSTLATALQKKIVVSPASYLDWREPVNMWCAPASYSGERKTPVFNKLLKPIIAFEKQKNALNKKVEKDAKRARDIAEKRIAELTNKAARESDDKKRAAYEAEISKLDNSMPELITPCQLWTGDVTAEELQNMLAVHGEKMSLLADEAGIFEVMSGLYNNGRSNIDVFLQSYSGSPVRVNRSGRTVLLESPATTFGITVQPGIIANLARGAKKRFRDIGALARFLYAMPQTVIGHRDFSRHIQMAPELQAGYDLLMTHFLQFTPEEPVRLYLSETGLNSFNMFGDYIEKNMRKGHKYEQIQDWCCKLPGVALRIAALWHCVMIGGAPVKEEHCMIEQRTIERACDFCEALISHARIAFDAMNDSDEVVANARKIQTWIIDSRQWYFTRRNLQQSLFNRTAAEELDEALNELIDRDVICTERSRKGTAGRPMTVHYVNPKVVDWPDDALSDGKTSNGE